MFQGNIVQKKKNDDLPLQDTLDRVKQMTNDYQVKNLVSQVGLSINNVTWEDCARNKDSVWGPCISDMTLQVNDDRMPVIRYANYSDKTWDVEIDKIPIVIGNEKLNSKLETISLKKYLQNFDQYISNPPLNKNYNLLVTNPNAKQKDTHVVMSAQACFLPVEKAKETKFNVALFNYQSKKNDPAILVIVATSKGSSAQVIEGNEQKLLFNHQGKKADFSAQRLTDNRIEKGLNIQGEMSKEEKQDNVIIIIQIPLKQKYVAPPKGVYNYFADDLLDISNNNVEYESAWNMAPQAQPQAYFGFNDNMNNNHNSNLQIKKKKSSLENKPDVEAAIVKIVPKLIPICIKCSCELKKMKPNEAYKSSQNQNVNCDDCGEQIKLPNLVWHCPNEKNWAHKDGFDLCNNCGEKQLQFNELNNNCDIIRDDRFPIRVTLQYYKSTSNGVVTKDILEAIKNQIDSSQNQADFIGSLVIDKDDQKRPTEPELPPPKKPMIEFNNVDWSWLFEKNEKESRDVIIAVLGQLNLNKYLKNFENNLIYDNHLLLLSKDEVKELIPDMGPRLKFSKWLEIYQAKNNDNKNDNNNNNDVNFLEGLI